MNRNSRYVYPINEQASFSFPTILEGLGAVITILWNEGNYDVLINSGFAAHLRFNEDLYAWYVADGEIPDADLVNEIGERIERSLANVVIR